LSATASESRGPWVKSGGCSTTERARRQRWQGSEGRSPSQRWWSEENPRRGYPE